MQSETHKRHLETRVSHSDCCECRADTERRFTGNTPFKYDHVREYLSWIRPRIEAIRQGEASVNARIWQRDFMRAMHNRISSHAAGRGRKWCDSYLERMGQFGNRADAAYLRQFAQRGTSCLDY